MNQDDVAPVESHSCPTGHPVPPGSRHCPTCGTSVGVPQPETPRDHRHLVLWVVAALAAVILVHVLVAVVVLGARH